MDRRRRSGVYNLNSKNNINSVKEVQDEEDGEMEKSGEQRLQERGPDVRELGKKRVSIVMEPLGARNDEGEERAERDELVEEMDTKIRELTEAVTSKDRELERLKETVRMLQEKVASSPRLEISAAKEGLQSFHDHRGGHY